ncbi:MAG: c-type cytochrome [Pseudomonadota bacterium]
MRGVTALVAFLAASPALASAQSAPAADHGARIFQRCAACHLPNGQGVPGAFPPLAGRLGEAASTGAGRDYLVMTVAKGVMGEIEIEGRKIRGVMPAQAGLTDADIAAVLNYAVALKAAGAAATPAPHAFTAEEVASIKARFTAATPNSVHAIRAGAFAPSAAESK